jgi:UDP-2,4-diacetamido-2,4,6-trideoxy-beta-L-altropyranose hydrolase
LSTKIIFRADAYAEIGTGHVMRCLALANACRKAGISTSFIGCIEDEILRARINQYGHEFTALAKGSESDWLDSISRDVSWIVLDGYGFDSQDHRKIRATGTKLLVIDDMANLNTYEADVILNQNFHANAADYHLAHEAKMLMGPKYALLREEFIGRSPVVRGEKAFRLLVTLGGSDPQNIGLLVVEALAKIGDMKFEVLLIAGSSNQHLHQLETAAKLARARGHIIDVRHYTDDMPDVMAWADFAIIAGGSTTLEVAYMGLPALVLILAENQAAAANAMQELGIAESLGWHNVLDSVAIAAALSCLAKDVKRRQLMTAHGQAFVNGLGAIRVVESMLNISVQQY